jgi:hypothetical protein
MSDKETSVTSSSGKVPGRFILMEFPLAGTCQEDKLQKFQDKLCQENF